MSEHSTYYAEAHFDAKAERYQTAIRSVRTARYLELIPFFFLLDSSLEDQPPRLAATDLFCGGGYLTEAFRGCFRHIYGVDVSQKMLRNFPRGPKTSPIKASVDEQSDLLTRQLKPDVIFSLAGLHHVYETEGGAIQDEASSKLQEQLITDWARSLAPKGGLVLADVSEPQFPASFTDARSKCFKHDSALRNRAEGLWRSLWESVNVRTAGGSMPADNIAAYVQHVTDATGCTVQASPGLWFREVVHDRGLFGHEDHFLKPESLLKAVRTQGFTVEYHEIPTPWIFPSREEFVFYFYEKFAFGPPAQTYSDIKSTTRRMIEETASKYLGVNELPNGGVATGWRLGYYRITKE